MAGATDQQPEVGKTAAPQPANSSAKFLPVADLALRLLLFAATLVALVVTLTSKQTKVFQDPLSSFRLELVAKFNYSSALIYFVVANSVVCLYSVLTVALSSSFFASKSSPATVLLLLLSSMDALMGGILASATGAVASIAYVGYKGNSHTGWVKVCNNFDKFCQHIGSSASLSLVASITLVFLVTLSSFSLYLRSH